MTPAKAHLNPQRKIPASLLALLFLSVGTVAPMAMAACDAPKFPITMPDGSSASMEQMTLAQDAVSAYVAAGEAYIACVDAELGRNQAERQRNAMLDDMEKIAGTFNRQLRVFKKSQS